MRTSKKSLNSSGDKKKKRRKIKLPSYSKLNKKLIKEFDNFLDFIPPDRLSRSLRNMFLQFLPHYVRDGVPTDLEETVIDIYFLLEFLDKSAKELEVTG